MLESKEDTIKLLQFLCSDPTELLTNANKLATFNVFLASSDLGFSLPVEFAIGSLFHHPLVVHGDLTEKVAEELEFSRKLCANILRCRQTLFAPKNKDDLIHLY
ncbi:hypothetical protein M3Y97_00652500 [Aphelenchoides bicaudatus]|nr:hypothetical protein M3Y97_00652500 [Aphelenchoides bicaudatus]